MMQRIIRFSFIIAIIGVITSPAYSQVGVTSVPFLNIEPDARSSGLGFTGLTQVGGANSSFWNPSLLANQEAGILSISHYNWLPNISSGITYSHLSMSTKITSASGVAIDFTNFNLGEQLARDENGNDLGSFGNSEFALRVAYGQKLSSNWSVGTAAQYFRSSLASGLSIGSDNIKPAGGIGFDLGGMYEKDLNLLGNESDVFRFGFNLSSFGSGIKYHSDQGRQALPTKLRIGWSYEFQTGSVYGHRFILTNEFSKRLSRAEVHNQNGISTYSAMNPFSALFKSWSPLDVNMGSESATLNTLQQLGIAVGAEYWFNNLLALRAGYFHENRFNGDRQLLTLGTGVRVNRIGVDFSYMNSVQSNHPLDNTLKLTVLINFNTPKRSPAHVITTIPEEYEIIQSEIAQMDVSESFVFEKATPTWVLVDTVYIQLSEGFKSVEFPDSDSPAAFSYMVETSEIAEKFDEITIQLKKVGLIHINITQQETEEFTELTNHYVLVVRPDPVFTFESVNFDFDKDVIRNEDFARLDHVIEIMNQYEQIRITLNGHTDNYGPHEYNINLSKRRSESVKAYLVERGISAERIELAWYSFDVPLFENNTRENRFKNRRVDIVQIEIN